MEGTAESEYHQICRCFFKHLPEDQETGFGTRSRRTSLSGGVLGQHCVPSAGADKLDTFVRCCVVGPFHVQ